jgi:hypothetical protein
MLSTRTLALPRWIKSRVASCPDFFQGLPTGALEINLAS